jgi:hypothetical protein
VQGAGHNIAGNAVCDGGIMISVPRLGGAGRYPRRNGQRDTGVRPRHPRGHQFHDRHRGAHTGRRFRVAQPQAWANDRQLDLG